jgi:hypothetical protein
MKMNIEKEIEGLNRRLSVLEDKHGLAGEPERGIIEMDLALPEADIDGLHFNETKVHAVFEKQDDGWYHSRDILFMSARNVGADNSRDILQEYLDDGGGDREIRAQIADMFDVPPTGVEIALPRKTQGAKKYNGAACWYWLAKPYWYWLDEPYSGSAAYFCLSYHDGLAYAANAGSVGGCAPVFRVRDSKP